MFKTISTFKNGSPHLEINEQGVVYDYSKKALRTPQPHRKKDPYYHICVNGKKQFLHILVAKAFPEICGKWFEGCEVHHKNKNPLDNRASNLMVVTKEEHIRLHAPKPQRHKRKSFEEKIEVYKKKGEIENVRYYCRKAKANKKGLAPIEMNFYLNGKRYTVNTGKYGNPLTF